MRRIAVLLLVAQPLSADDEATVSKVRYDDLGRFVAEQRGKVVVVDFWATYCVPCKAAFPHLVALHQKYRGQGLVVVSVSVDDPADPKSLDKVKGFLKQQKATMTNFLLDEPAEVWQKKLGSESVPVVFVFNRTGQIEEKYTDKPKPVDFEVLVVKLLSRKGTP